MRSLVHRNLQVFFRDIGAVALSLLAALVLFLLYVAFLGGLQVETLQEQLPAASVADIEWFVSSWVFAGIVMITTVTTGIAGLATFVQDRASGRYKDFLVAPVRGWQLIAGYLVSSALIAVLMSVVVLAIGQLYLVLTGYPPATAWQLLQTLAAIVLLSLTFSGMSAFVVTFVKSTGAFGALSTVVGTVVGFLAGAYLPLGLLSATVVNTLNVLPFSQAAMLVRLPLTENSVSELTGGNAEAGRVLNEYFGMTLLVNDAVVSPLLSVMVLLALLVLFTGSASLRIGVVLRR
ncbi:MAG: ABC transporter permease [Cryobacterium sp.]